MWQASRGISEFSTLLCARQGFDNYLRGEKFAYHEVCIGASNYNVIKYHWVGVYYKAMDTTLSR